MIFYQKPIIGILAFLVVLFVMPLGHALMILMEKVFGAQYQFAAAAFLGIIGGILVLIGTKDKTETTATWLGFFGGVLLWTGWVEFSFIWIAQHLNISPLMANGEIVTKPEYLIMPSSIGILLSTMFYFLLNNQTRCNFFIWLNRNLKLKLQIAPADKKRNFATITAMETIYVTWFFYIILLLVYDDSLFGDKHPVTYFVFAGSLAWSLFLINRLLKINKMAYAIRYAIPTVILFWNCIEILGRWNFFKEIWIEPHEYYLEMGLILFGFFSAMIFSLMSSRLSPKPN